MFHLLFVEHREEEYVSLQLRSDHQYLVDRGLLVFRYDYSPESRRKLVHPRQVRLDLGVDSVGKRPSCELRAHHILEKTENRTIIAHIEH